FTVTLPIESVDEQLAPDLRSVATAILEEPLIAPQEDGLPETTLSAGPDAPLILIVEDNADVREYLRSHLGSNYRLVEAEDGEAGLAATREHRPDLIISDIMMPRMDGYEMCRLIKKNEDLRHIPVIMLTAKAGEHDTVEGLQSGADDYMAKPFSVTELEARVGNFISSRRLLREKYSHEIIVKPGDIEIAPEEEVFLDSVLEAVNSHLADSNYTVDWLADDIGLSRRQLERRVQAVTGQSPADLVRNLRLQRASQLLRAHAGTVAEIAYSVGFTSPKHFSTAFSKQFGESPTAYATHRSSE
ncbi:MAG: response regulator, partial [Rhodothermales bacterium]